MKIKGAPCAAVGIVVAAATFAAVLCVVNTLIAPVTATQFAIVDAAIVLAALALALRGAPQTIWLLTLALGVNFLAVALFSESFTLKSVRDPLALIAFCGLGLRYGGFDRARRTFAIVSALVIAMGLFEYLAPGAYVQVFNVIDFYRARGVVDAGAYVAPGSSFFVSGVRGGERMLLPFLGPHRVSSIFLEPVSMGNFGAIAMALALSLDRRRWRSALAAAAVGAFAIVFADARFASFAAVLFVVARLAPTRWVSVILAPMPLAAIAVLLAFGLSDTGAGDDLPTRLAISGRTLLELDPQALLGIASGEVSTVDSGYAYVLSAFGAPLCILLWVSFILFPARAPEAARFKLMLGVYICALLCISGSSLFAIKTAALAWFILGALAYTAPARTPAPAAQTQRALA